MTMEVGGIQRKHERAGKMDVEELRRDTEQFLAENEEPYRKTLDLLAGTWAFVAENIEREAWKSYTREQWAKFEHEHVEKAKYTEPDLRDDLLTRVEYGGLSLDDARAEHTTYKECKYVFCINVFKQTRKDRCFCSRDCKERQRKAIKRFEETGTYLPSTVYKENRDDTKEREYRQKETAYEPDIVSDYLLPMQRRREYGYKKCRETETRLHLNTAKRGTKSR